MTRRYKYSTYNSKNHTSPYRAGVVFTIVENMIASYSCPSKRQHCPYECGMLTSILSYCTHPHRKQNLGWTSQPRFILLFAVSYICENYGEAAAVSFAIGCDILTDNIEEDICSLSSYPRGTHIGQLPASMLEGSLPEQFLMRYDYEFLCCLKFTIKTLKTSAHHNIPIVAHTVM